MKATLNRCVFRTDLKFSRDDTFIACVITKTAVCLFNIYYWSISVLLGILWTLHCKPPGSRFESDSYPCWWYVSLGINASPYVPNVTSKTIQLPSNLNIIYHEQCCLYYYVHVQSGSVILLSVITRNQI